MGKGACFIANTCTTRVACILSPEVLLLLVTLPARPHALYKRALIAIRSWTPPEADAHDVKALACLAAAAEQLQKRLGYPVPPPAATSAAADGAQPCPASDGSSDAAMASGDGVAAEGAMRRISGLACSSPLCDPLDSPALAAVWPAVARLDAAVAAYPGGPAAAAGGTQSKLSGGRCNCLAHIPYLSSFPYSCWPN